MGNFLGRIFLGGFLREDFWGGLFGGYLGGILWEEFFVYIGIDLFVKILSQSNEEEEFQSLEVREQAPSHLIIVKI